MRSQVPHKGTALPSMLLKTHGLHLRLARPDTTPTVRAALMFAWRCILKDKAACVGQKRTKYFIPVSRPSNFVSTGSIVRCHCADQLPLRPDCPASSGHRPNLQKQASVAELIEHRNGYGPIFGPSTCGLHKHICWDVQISLRVIIDSKENSQHQNLNAIIIVIFISHNLPECAGLRLERSSDVLIPSLASINTAPTKLSLIWERSGQITP